MYAIKQDGGYYDAIQSLQEAIELAEALLGGVLEGEESTFTVEDENGCLKAAVTNRRIVGFFIKQEWGGRKGNDSIHISEDEFDATNAILLMRHAYLAELQDHDESSDIIGRAHIDWPGPCYVNVVDSVCSFFGVSEIRDITPEALAYARNRANPHPPAEATITLNIKLNLRVTAGASVNDFIENLDYSVISNTVGVTVSNTEIIDCD
jgi:hypothetical protein